MTKTMKIKKLIRGLNRNEEVCGLNGNDGESAVYAWIVEAGEDYPISGVFSDFREKGCVYIRIDDRNLVDLLKMWHDASEEPEDYFKQIIYQDKTGTCRFTIMHDIVVLLQLKWDDFAAAKITRWAYISDLLPKGGEK